MPKSKIMVLLMSLLISSFSFSATDDEIQYLKKVANLRHMNAQAELGSIYLFGETKSGNPDYKQAAYWYEKAATQGDATSQYNLAILYFRGFGVTQNLELAFNLYKKSAEQGHSDAQFQLALRYLNGEGTTKNLQISKYWFQQSFISGNTESKTYLEQLSSISITFP